MNFREDIIEETKISGVKISLTNPSSAVQQIKGYLRKKGGYVCIFGLNILVRAFEDKELKTALNGALLNPLHGKSIELYLKLKRFKNVQTVDGYYLLQSLLESDATHFFYGTNKDTLGKIKKRIELEFPDAKVLGYKVPPKIDINSIASNKEVMRDIEEISQHKPDIVWVGLGGIKQDLVMCHYHKVLNGTIMIGIGAVFDYFAGNLQLSSEKVKKFGFRWLYRLFLQPRLFGKIIKTIWLTLFFPIKKMFKK